MLIQFSAAAGLIAATVVIQALFMSMGARTFRWVEEHRPMVMARRPTSATVIWILFLMIPIILTVTLWAIFYYVQDALPSFVALELIQVEVDVRPSGWTLVSGASCEFVMTSSALPRHRQQ